MSASETDLELLETYLDDQLTAEEGDALRRRLASEPALVAAMDQLRQERELRREVYASMESDRGTDHVLRAVRAAATREIVRGGQMRILRRVSAAAACLVVGVLAGWMWRGGSAPQPSQPGGTAVVSRPSNPNISLVEDGGSPRGRSRVGGYNVSITDDFGRVLAVQHFDTLNEAREFSNDLGRWQNKQRQLRNSDIKLIGDEF
jgi:hypothetical protein